MNNNKKVYDDELCVIYKGIEIKANLIYRSRKSISIQIRPVNNVSIISPKQISKKVLREMLIEKGDWILEKLNQYKDKEEYYKEKEFVSGEKIFYLGEEYILKVLEVFNDNNKQKTMVEIKENEIIVKSINIEKEFIKKELKNWYKNESERLILERIVHCKNKSHIMMNLTPKSVKVKEQKRRWGSCTSQGNIYINSKISMLKPEVIDYIIVHEFSHLVHMNHSKDFYSLVKSIMPEYKAHENWLRENSYKLTL